MFAPLKIPVVLLVLLLLLVACAPEPATDSAGLIAVTAVPANSSPIPIPENDCESLQSLAVDQRIERIEALISAGQDCEGIDLAASLYQDLLAQGDAMQELERDDEALAFYERAYALAPDDPALLARLQSLRATTPVPLAECDDADEIATLEDYTPTRGEPALVAGRGFELFLRPFTLHGLEYRPRDYPPERFFTGANVDALGVEFDLMRGAGINALRFVLLPDALFACPGSEVPVAAAFERLDEFIHAASERGYKLILVIEIATDQPDELARLDALLPQIAFIAARYRDEQGVMAYDPGATLDGWLRKQDVTLEQALMWLALAATEVRRAAPDHLVTAALPDDAEATAPLVDFVSFVHPGEYEALRQEMAILSAATSKPVVVVGIGYSSEPGEIAQRDRLLLDLEAVQINALAGWFVREAFDPPLSRVCPQPCADDAAYRFGLWNSSYFPKRAVDVLRLASGLLTRADLAQP